MSYKTVDYVSTVGASLTVKWDYHADWDGHYCEDTSKAGKKYKDSASSVRAWVSFQYE